MAPGRRPPAHWPTQHVLHLRLHVTTGAGGVPTATAACSHRPADWSRDGWSGPRTSPTHCDPAVPPETPIRGASRPEGNLLSKPHGLARPPTGRSPGRHTRSRGCGGGLRPAPRRAGRGTRLPGANAGRSRSVATGHGAGWRRLSETAPVGKPAAAPVLRAAASPFSPDRRGRSGPSPTLTARSPLRRPAGREPGLQPPMWDLPRLG